MCFRVFLSHDGIVYGENMLLAVLLHYIHLKGPTKVVNVIMVASRLDERRRGEI